MKLLTTILTLACSSAFLCSATWAQGNESRTFTGNNGPQGGPAIGDNFMVNIYGQGDVIAIEVKNSGGDGECGRPFYITGTIILAKDPATGTVLNRGSIGGPMLRCTNKDLKNACANVGVTLTDYYEVGYTGTVQRSADQGSYVINITYPYATWVREDCKEARTAQGTERIVLTYSPAPPPASPDPGWTDWFRKQNEWGNQKVRDVFSGRTFRLQ
jgi:hypothetical protein